MNQLKSAMLAAALALGYAGAATAEETGFYAGVGLGQSTVEIDDVDFDEDDTGFKLFGGFQFNKYFAVELAYIDGGEPEIGGVEIENTQVNASAVGTYAFNDFFGVMGRLGISYTDVELKVRGLGTIADDNETDIAYGVGAWVAPTSNIFLRLEYELTKPDFDGTDVDVSLISVSAAYRFGR